MSTPEIRPASTAVVRGPLLYIGAFALLLAVAVEAVAVVGRHLGIPFLGSLELVQAAIVLASSAAVVAATLTDRHASARFLLDRVGPRARGWLMGSGRVLTLLFFLVLASGQIWITHDLWNSHEDSELLHIPLVPLRLISIAAVLSGAAIILRRLRPGSRT